MRLTPEHVQGLALRSRRPDEAGGEWDTIRALPARVLRQLRGAGYLGRPGAYAPDELAHELAGIIGDVSTCEAMHEWQRAVRELLSAQRRDNARRREQRLARARGHATWNAYRAALYAGRAGSETVHDYCRQIGWRP
jgi:hypothetical protein